MNTKKQMFQLYGIGTLFSFLLILFDQITKYLAVVNLKGQPSFIILEGVFELHYLENHGAAFSMLQGKRLFLILVTVLMVILLAYVYGRIPIQKKFYVLHGICIALFSGAIGNFIDRMTNNYVIDFLYFSLINFPVFNVADIYVTCAMTLFILLFLFYYKENDLDDLAAFIIPWQKSSEAKKHE